MIDPSGSRSAAIGTSPKSPLRTNAFGSSYKLIFWYAGKISGGRAGDEGAVLHFRIENLRGQRLPAARRSAEGGARPSLCNAAIFRLDGRNQLLVDGRAVGPHIG